MASWRARSEGGATKLPSLARRVGSSPPERKAASSQSTVERSKLPSIRPGGYRSDMAPDTAAAPAARPKTRPAARPSAAKAAPSKVRPPAASSTGSTGPAADAMDLKNYVSDELRKVLEEEEVSYSWRRRPQKPSSPPVAPAATTVAPAAPVVSGGQRPGENGQVKSSKKTSPKAAPSAGYGTILEVRMEKTAGAATAATDLAAPSFCAKLEASELQPAVRLVTYDGSPPMLMAGPLCGSSVSKTARPPVWFLRWVQGRSSSRLFSVAAEDWLRAESAMEGTLPGRAEPGAERAAPKALLSGLLGDPAASSQVQELSQLSPSGATCKALHELLSAVTDDGDGSGARELLTSQVEVALGRLEGGSAAGLLPRALRRELLRALWCSSTWEGPSCAFDDQWLLQQLQLTTLGEGSEERWRKENEFLDRYLVRLLKLKRSLSSLLESWQKVDHYAILGVSSSASDKELRNAYRKACLRLHPDKGGDKQQFQQLQDSYAWILEQRQQHGTPGVPAAAAAPAAGGGPGRHLSIEGAATSPDSGAAAAFGDAQQVAGGVASFKERAEEMRSLLKEAWAAEAQLQQATQLQGRSTTVETLAVAQEAGEKLMELSQKIGALAPNLSEASMEVAECSLALAARHGATAPCALLLLDVALSMTLEAVRVQQTGKTLLDMRRDTWGTLQTLQQNLSMARILGSVDVETFKLSVGLVRKATSRILQGIKEVQKASDDALQRGHHCLIHANCVCRFAAGRPSDLDTNEEELLALEGATCQVKPGGQASSPPGNSPGGQATRGAANQAGASSQPPREAETETSQPWEEAGGGKRSAPEWERRLQNQRLLVQLNAEVRELQRRAKAAMKSEKEEEDVSDLVRELLWVASDGLVTREDLQDPQLLRAALAQEFHFVEVAGSVDLAVPCELPAQLLRYGVLLDSQQVLRELLKAKQRVMEKVTCEACVAVLEQHFEQLSASVVAARLS